MGRLSNEAMNKELVYYSHSVLSRARDIIDECRDIRNAISIIIKQDSTVNEKSLMLLIGVGDISIVELIAIIYASESPLKKKGSSGEIDVMNILISMNLDYIREHIFKGLPKKRFDFYIESLNLCIEYDGIQHYKPIEYFGGNKTLYKIQKNDNIKNRFCDMNNINILRIPYTEHNNINNIIKDFINGL